jgi:hypothetical protein
MGMLMRVILSVFFLNFLIAEISCHNQAIFSHAFQLQFEILGPGASPCLNIDSGCVKLPHQTLLHSCDQG